jgi:hypothetical protein
MRGQLTLVDLQLAHVNRVLRMYTKVLGSKAVCRVEESVTINAPILDALKSFRPDKDGAQPNLPELQAQIQALQLVKGFQYLCERQEAANRQQLDQTGPEKLLMAD